MRTNRLIGLEKKGAGVCHDRGTNKARRSAAGGGILRWSAPDKTTDGHANESANNKLGRLQLAPAAAESAGRVIEVAGEKIFALDARQR